MEFQEVLLEGVADKKWNDPDTTLSQSERHAHKVKSQSLAYMLRLFKSKLRLFKSKLRATLQNIKDFAGIVKSTAKDL